MGKMMARGGRQDGLAQVLDDLLWEAGQIGQAALDMSMVVVMLLLVYAHIGGLRAPVVTATAATPPCAAGPLTGSCIVVEVLQPPAT